jgi:hypothetical protein
MADPIFPTLNATTGKLDADLLDLAGVAPLVGGKVPASYLPVSSGGGGVAATQVGLSYAGVLSLRAGLTRIPLPFAPCTITGVRIMVGVSPTGAPVTVDVNLNGATIFANQAGRPSIAAGTMTDAKALALAVPSVAAWPYLTFDVDSVGSGTKGSDLVIVVTVAPA